MTILAENRFAGQGGVQRRIADRLLFPDKVVALLIFLFWLLYENVVFFYSMEYGGAILFAFTNACKLALPFLLLAYTGLPSHRLLGSGSLSLYVALFAAFLLWGLVPTLLDGDALEWLKLLPRFVFFLSVAAFLSQRPAAFALFAKCMVAYVLLALVQYALVYLTGAYLTPIKHDNQLMAGPGGMFGNVTSMMFYPGTTLPVVRLAGFWNEPSNASASAFAAFFLSRFLAGIDTGSRWRWASYACLVAGLLTLSNAGYFALGSAVLFGLLFAPGAFSTRRVVQLALLSPIAIAMFVIVVFGRTYVAENMADNIWARAITGVQDIDTAALDPTSGRLELATQTVEKARAEVIGVGIQETGTLGIDASASAPLFWLLLTGIPGLLLLLAREGVLLVAARTLVRRAPLTLPLAQALIVVMAQHLSYGSWMNPNYFILAAMILVSSRKDARSNWLPTTIPGS